MKKIIRLGAIALVLLATLVSQAQTPPQGMNYQSVARNAAGQLLTSHSISVRFSIHDSIATGPVMYRETQTVLTNQFGTFSVVIGGGIISTGTFGGVNWASGPKHLQVEMDFNGGSSYTDMGTSQLMSVPYSLYSAGSAGNITNIKYDTTGIINIYTGIPSVITSVKGTWLTGGNGGLSAANNFIGTTDNVDLILKRQGLEGLRMTAGGALLATGNDVAGVAPMAGGGKRMMWVPSKAAFRAGFVSGAAWDQANIGMNSVALGTDVLASGTGSVAIGNNSQAIGDMSIALGNGIIAKSYMSMVIGLNNDTTSSGSLTSINQNDVLFQIGNGNSATSRSNALTVNKKGQVIASQLLVSQSMVLQDTTINVTGNFSLAVESKGFVIIHSMTSPSSNLITLNPGVRKGQILLIEVTGSGSSGVRFTDSSANGMNLGNNNNNIDLLNQDTITLLWDGTLWIELSTSSNH